MRCLRIIALVLSIQCSRNLDAGGQVFSGGLSHTLFLCDNGSVYSWGDNTYGQLGLGSELSSMLTPAKISQLDGVVAIDAGEGSFSVALKDDGTVWAWGHNASGQLGSATFCSDSASTSGCEMAFYPICVSGGQTGRVYLDSVMAVIAGYEHAAALLGNGCVVTWGDNTYGQLGNGTFVAESSPVFVLKDDGTKLDSIASICAGAFFTLAISTDGKVWGWGMNTSCELGCGNKTDQSFAARVLLDAGVELDDIKAVSGGLHHAILLTSGGEVYGTGAYMGATSCQDTVFYEIASYPRKVKGGQQGTDYLRDVVAISAGMAHSLVLADDGTSPAVFSWGNNRFPLISTSQHGGQLGMGSSSIAHSLLPVRIVSSLTQVVDNVVSICATSGCSFMIVQNPATGAEMIYACGVNDVGQLGTLDYEDRFYASKVLFPTCDAGCPVAFLGDNRSMCLPILDTLNTSYSDNAYVYRWFKNDTILLGQDKSQLPISEPAKYTVQIIDTIKSCPSVADEININSRSLPFSIIPSIFCGDTVTFRAFGSQNFNWYTKRLSGQYLGSGAEISVAKRYLPGKLSDTVKTAWLFTKECQPLPVQSRKYCDTCELVPPEAESLPSYCLESSAIITAAGSSIKWYDSTNALVSIDDTLSLVLDDDGTFTYYATQSDSLCESQADTVSFAVTQCVEVFNVSGSVTPNVAGALTFFDYAHLPAIIAQTALGVGGYYSVDIPQSTVIMRFDPSSSGLYLPTYFGNTASLESAYVLDVNANVGGADISLKACTGFSSVEDEPLNISPTIASKSIRVRCDIPCDVTVSCYVVSSEGFTCLRLDDVSVSPFFIDVSSLPAGIYHVVITSGAGHNAGSFIKM